MIGFLTLNFSDVPPFWHLGNITAFGMTMAFFFSMTTLPALMAIFPVKTRVREAKAGRTTNLYTRFGEFVSRHPARLSLASIAIIGVLAFLATTTLEMFTGYRLSRQRQQLGARRFKRVNLFSRQVAAHETTIFTL